MAGNGRSGTETRQRVLSVALPLFARHGFDGVSVRRLADAATVNVATLAYHFGDKRGLYLAVIARLYGDLQTALGQLRLRDDGGGMRSMIDTGWTFVCGHRDHLRLLLRGVLDQGRHAPEVVDRWSGPLLDQADQLIAVMRPELGPVARRMLVLMVSHALVRMALEDSTQLSTMLAEPEDLDSAVVDSLVEIIRSS